MSFYVLLGSMDMVVLGDTCTKKIVPGRLLLCISIQPWSLTASQQLCTHLGEQRLSSTSARQKIGKKASTTLALLDKRTLMPLISSNQNFLEREQCCIPFPPAHPLLV